MKTLRVELGKRSYPIIVGSGVLERSGALLRRLEWDSAPIVVTNAKVWSLHGRTLSESLENVFGPPPVVCIPDGERFKSHATVLKIYEGFFRAQADRRTWVVAFGGGVVGDIAGFAAATFMRGIRYVHIPTTLLAQVDSSIGGKVGINVEQGKNLIGAFYQPSAVLTDVDVLRTLPQRELAAGLYEVVKCGAIRSEPLLRYIERRVPEILRCERAALQHVVLEAAKIKTAVVSSDETERDLRMVLNFGHTVGHALEAATAYRRFKHGEAVAWGMVAALCFGRQMGLLSPGEVHRLITLIHRIARLPGLKGIKIRDVWDALNRDKKSRRGAIQMVLLSRLGQTESVSNIDPSALRSFLVEFLEQRGGIELDYS